MNFTMSIQINKYILLCLYVLNITSKNRGFSFYKGVIHLDGGRLME